MQGTRICLTHNTADDLLEALALAGAELHPSSLQARDFSPQVDPVLEGLREFCGAEKAPFNLLIGSDEDNRADEGVVCHRLRGDLPSGSILQVEEGIYLASPSLNLLLEARDLHLVNLCRMLGRYMGTFSTKVADEESGALVERAPLVTADDLNGYLTQFTRVAGRGNLLDAMRFTCENAASPQEVNLQLALCLPPSCNGYALRKPLMNCPIKLGADERCFYDVDYIRIDLYWPGSRFGLEYQGEKEHRDRMLQDIARWYAARKRGIDLWFVTKEQLSDARQMDFIAREVARRTKKRVAEGTWPTIDEAQRLLEVLQRGTWLNPDEKLRTRALRTRQRAR